MKKLNLVVAISVLALSTAVTGCNKGSGDVVLVKVNRAGITEADFKRQLGDLAPQMQRAVVSDPKARQEFLEDLIGIELVIQEAKKLGLDKDAEFKKTMEAHKKETEEYKKKIEQQLQDAAKNELFTSVLKKELGDKLSKVPEPTSKEVSEYYNKNKDKIRAATGKQASLKEIEPQLKMRLMQEKRRDLYLEYAKGLKAKAKISVDDKALETAMTALGKSVEIPDGLQVQKVPTPQEEKKK